MSFLVFYGYDGILQKVMVRFSSECQFSENIRMTRITPSKQIENLPNSHTLLCCLEKINLKSL